MLPHSVVVLLATGVFPRRTNQLAITVEVMASSLTVIEAAVPRRIEKWLKGAIR